jgi:NAD(P)-dependent dehydrogenase (short-subunit alcohol dehydrogenase family)
MVQKTVLITGSTSGIGLAGAEALARKGWRVLVHARSEARGRGALEGLQKAVPGGSFDLVTGDLASLKSVVGLADQVAAKVSALDVLWNNAGGMQTEARTSADGLELQMAVNHLAPFALTARLLPLVQAAPAGRVVATASMAHAFAPGLPDQWFAPPRGRYSPMGVYGTTKLANILFTRELQRRLSGTSVTAHCFHPGWVRTGFGSGGQPQKWNLMSAASSLLALPPEQGADTGVFLTDDPQPVTAPGLYWIKRKPASVSKLVTDQAAQALWEQSEREFIRILGSLA